MYHNDDRDQSAIMASIIAARDSSEQLTKDSILETDSVSTPIKHYKFETCWLLKLRSKHKAYLKVEQKSSMEEVQEFHNKRSENANKQLNTHKYLVNEVDYAVQHHKKLCFDEWILVRYFEMTPTTLEGLMRKRGSKGRAGVMKTFELRLMLQEIAQGLSHLHEQGKFHGSLNPLEIGLTVDGHCKLWADSVIETQHEYKVLQKNLIFRKNQGIYQSPRVYNSLIRNSFKFKVNPVKEDSFSVGLIILEAGSGISGREIYPKDQAFDHGQLAFMLEEFEKRHASDPQLVRNVRGLCEVDDSVRLDIDGLDWGVFIQSSNPNNPIQRNVTDSNFFQTNTDSGPFVIAQSSNSQKTGTQFRSFKSFNNSKKNYQNEGYKNAGLKKIQTEKMLNQHFHVQSPPVFKMKKSKTNSNLPVYYKYEKPETQERRYYYPSEKTSHERFVNSRSVPKKRQIYSNRPHQIERLPRFDAPVNKYDNYTQKLEGYNMRPNQNYPTFNNNPNYNFPKKEINNNGKYQLNFKPQILPVTLKYNKSDESNIIKKVTHQRSHSSKIKDQTPDNKIQFINTQWTNPYDINTKDVNTNTIRTNDNREPENRQIHRYSDNLPLKPTNDFPNNREEKNYDISIPPKQESNPPLEDSQGNQYKIDANEFFAAKMNQGFGDNPSNFNSKFNLLSNNFDGGMPSEKAYDSNTPSYLFEQQNFGSNPKDFDEKFQINPDDLFSQRMFNSNDVRGQEADAGNSFNFGGEYLTVNSGSQDAHQTEQSRFWLTVRSDHPEE